MADDDPEPHDTGDGNPALFQSRQIGGTDPTAGAAPGADGDGGGQASENGRQDKRDEEPTITPAAVDLEKPKPVTPEMLAEHREAGFFRLAVIGYPGTGKTCFLNRLKWEITRSEDSERKGQYRIEPPLPEKRIGQTPGIECHGFWWTATTEGEPVEAATDDDSDADLAKSFVVYDVAGEVVINPDNIARLHQVLAHSDAIVIVLPSDVVLAAGDKAEIYLTRVHDHLDERIGLLQPPAPPTSPDIAPASVAAGASPNATAPVSTRTSRKLADDLASDREATLARLRLDADRLEAMANDTAQIDALESRLKADRDGVEQFIDKLGAMIAVSGAMRNAELDYDAYQAIPEAERRKHGRRVRPPLAYIAISKTDSLLSDEPLIVPLDEKLVQELSRHEVSGLGTRPSLTDHDWTKHEREARARIDEDPMQTIRFARDSLRKVVRKTFSRHKIDFLTSFDELQKSSVLFPQDAATQYSDDIDYTVASYGVPAVIDWIAYARKRRQPQGWRPPHAIQVALKAAVKVLPPTMSWRRAVGLAAMVLLLAGLAYFFPAWGNYLVVAMLVVLVPLLVGPAFDLARLVRTVAVKLEWAEFALARGGWVARGAGFLVTAGLLLGFGIVTSDQLSGLSRTKALAAQPGEARALRELKPRYPAEAAYLQQSGLFTQGRLSESVQPWSGVPEAGGYFGVPAGPVRNQYLGILATIRQWRTTGPIEPEQAATVARQLAGLQGEIVAARAGQADGDIDRRSFSYYHLGLAQLRSGQWKEAIGEFEKLRELIETTEPPTTEQAKRRAEGVSIALRHAKGLALLKLGQPAEAKTQLAEARAKADAAHDWLITDAAAPHIIAPDANVTPAQFTTVDIDTDLLAAWLQTFDPARDLLEDSTFRLLVEDMGARATGIASDQALRTNLTLAEALLGEPLSLSPDLDGPQPVKESDRDTVEEARNAFEGQGDWVEAKQVREAFEEGTPDDIDRLFEPTENDPRDRQRRLAQKVAREILGDLRARKQTEGRSEDLAPFVDKVPGFDAAELAKDMAGGWGWYWLRKGLPWLPVAFGFLVLLLVMQRTFETNAQQTSARHYGDRKKAAAKREGAAAKA